MGNEFISFDYQVSRITTKHNRFVKDFNNKLFELHKQGIRVFIQEALRYIPTYTGMSRASFIPLAEAVGTDVDIEPESGAKTSSKKSIPAGEEAGEEGRGFSITKGTDGQFGFRFSPRVFHLRINDLRDATQYVNPETGDQYFHLITPGPYGAFAKGRLAYFRYIKSVIPTKLPKVKEIFAAQSGLVSIKRRL